MREPGFEPELMPWQGIVIPLHYSRVMEPNGRARRDQLRQARLAGGSIRRPR